MLKVVEDEGTVFNTKERCPCLLYFETAHVPGLEGTDVASLVHEHVARGVDEPVRESEVLSDTRATSKSLDCDNPFDETKTEDSLQRRRSFDHEAPEPPVPRTLATKSSTFMPSMFLMAAASASSLHQAPERPCVMSQSFEVASYGGPHVSESAMSHPA